MVYLVDPNAEGPSLGDTLRQSQPTEIFDRKVVRIDDLRVSKRYNLKDSTEETIDLPASDVLSYFLDDGSRIIVRPSGTEPKVKCYYEIIETIAESESFETGKERADQRLSELVKSHQSQISKH